VDGEYISRFNGFRHFTLTRPFLVKRGLESYRVGQLYTLRMDDTVIETDLHCLALRFAETRMQTRQMVEAMARSIERDGQVTPVAAIRKEESDHPFVLMDGYLRIAALRRLGADTVMVTIWNCDEASGLLRVLTTVQARHWAAIEEARTIQTLMRQFNKSQHTIAKEIGRDVSWVNRRLSLIAGVSDEILITVNKGNLSIWAASRVMAPLARANSAHATSMLAFLEHHPLSTREMQSWHQHYQKANCTVRENMVKAPDLFLAAMANKEQEKQADKLRQGPEGAWLKDLNATKAILKRQRSAIPMLFSSPHNEIDQQPLHQVFVELQAIINGMDSEIRELTA